MARAMIYPEPEKGGRGTARRTSSALKVWSPSAGTALIRPEGPIGGMGYSLTSLSESVTFVIRHRGMIGLSFLVPWVSFRPNPQG
jgi:hypothetical protein